MKRIYILSAIFILSVLIAGCFPKEFKDNANKQFGDQYFKTAISLIELHNVRNGDYPDTLDDLEYLGEWDKMIYNAVEYKKLDEGYELNLKQGWIGKPENLDYPKEFWKGLGLRKSNMK